jgi:hypothetical protein
MSPTPHLYSALGRYLSQWCLHKDLRHLKALAWMIVGLVYSQKLNLTAWEPYVQSPAQYAQSYQRRWRRFLANPRISVSDWYVPLVMQAIGGWKQSPVSLALDTTMLWNEYCMIHLSVVGCGRAVPLLWKTLKHKSASVAFEEYRPLLDQAHGLLSEFSDVTLLADRAFPAHELLQWLGESRWHWCLRLAKNTQVHGPLGKGRSCPISYLAPKLGEAKLYHNIGLWEDGLHRCNLVLAYPHGIEVDDFWAIITDLPPSLEVLRRYSERFCCEELFLDSKSAAFGLEQSRIRDAQAITRLYLVVAVALLFCTQQGLAVQLAGLRRQVDPHWERGISFLKIGLNWVRGAIHKGRSLLTPLPLPARNPEPCFASRKAKELSYNTLLFQQVSVFLCPCN